MVIIPFLLILVAASLDATRPNTYWLEISYVQAFEGEEGVVLFVEVERAMRYGRIIQSPSINKPAQLFRIVVSWDGRVNRTSLKFGEREVTFNSYIAPILRHRDHFYMVAQPSMERPSCQLQRIAEDRIEVLDPKESDRIIGEIGLIDDGRVHSDNLERFDLVSKQNGWESLFRGNQIDRSEYTDLLKSKRHGLRLVLIEENLSQRLVAMSTSERGSWSKELVRVDTTPWKSHQEPLD